MNECPHGLFDVCCTNYDNCSIGEAKKEWVGLTEKETIDLALNAFALPEVSLEQRLRLHQELVIAMNEPDSRLMIFAATIEQALKEKNT
jgi:hypothetical protein